MQTNDSLTILRIDASARQTGSITRALGDELLAALRTQHANTSIMNRDLAQTPPTLLSADWVSANFTDPQQRNTMQQATLAESDALVAELLAADVIVLDVPIYNFSVPAALKAWIDLVARARVTFRYTENGPVGLLQNKRAYLLMASGGVSIGSEMDFASGYLRQVLGFLGITAIEIIACTPAALHNEAIAQVRTQITQLFATAA